MVLSLLSTNERAYLAGSKELTPKQRRDIKYRLNKKIAQFRDAADFCDAPPLDMRALVAQLAERGLVNNNIVNSEIITSPRRDLNARPKVFAPTGYNISPSEELRNLRREKKAIQLS